MFSKNESTFPINISESVFEDHHKYYKILVYNKNPVGQVKNILKFIFILKIVSIII